VSFIMKIHKIKGYIQVIYLVEYDHGLLLLDGCSRPDADVINTYITHTLERPLTDLKLVMVSHMHPDHAGAAHLLRKQTGCSIGSANVHHSWYGGFQGWLMFVTDILLTKWVAGKKGSPSKNIWYAPTLRPDYKLNEGDLLPGFADWRVIETPGHTDRDISLLHEPSHKIYVADLIVKVRGKFVPPFPIFHPNKYKNSIDHLINLEPDSLLLAHGGEQKLTVEELQFLRENAPQMPKTHWRAAKYHFWLMLQRS